LQIALSIEQSNQNNFAINLLDAVNNFPSVPIALENQYSWLHSLCSQYGLLPQSMIQNRLF